MNVVEMLGDEPLVTVLMAVFNGEDSVLPAVESMRSQTFEDWELLIVNDASSDDTATLLARETEVDPRIRVIQNAKNIGLAACLNAGVKRARGKLIARMDADDISLPDRLERQVGFMKEHPDIDILGGGAKLLDGSGRVLGYLQPPELHQRLTAELFFRTPFIHPSVMIRKEVLEQLGGYDERLRKGQDTDLWLRAAEHGFRFHNLQTVVLHYRFKAPSWRAIGYGAYVLLCYVHRNGGVLRKGFYVLRFIAGALIRKMGLRALCHPEEG